MRDEYIIEELKPSTNPYAGRLKKQVTMNIDSATIDYFESLADAHQPLSARLRRQSAEVQGVLAMRSSIHLTTV